MQVHINEVVSHISAVDGESLLSPAAMQRIVSAAVTAIHEMQSRERSRGRDTRLDSGGDSADTVGQGQGG